jgi:hypothetical protein
MAGGEKREMEKTPDESRARLGLRDGRGMAGGEKTIMSGA